MPKVSFYTHIARPHVFACRLAVRAMRDSRVLLWCESETELSTLDRDLWQLQPESFIPHDIWQPDTPLPADTPLLLACGSHPPALPDPSLTVLNLSPDFWHSAPVVPGRVLEIVGDSLEALDDARARFRAYKSSGFEIEHFDMKGKA
ncbi:DNA polymerase III subunit chi [Bergeriella denitrificans]|uniref:DNA polymerase III subunit chi n=1 Tax=Bergeriella denitrificans TaxID=494 RepID=A0A378UE78_BERDE|nr:DNA polymerase III subunit chi [Bergeriella denitrificans]STZ75728.1 DNA polymerase III subunit chi [Bergeriella denitrificans]